jgi:hypothetical protein
MRESLLIAAAVVLAAAFDGTVRDVANDRRGEWEAA